MLVDPTNADQRAFLTAVTGAESTLRA